MRIMKVLVNFADAAIFNLDSNGILFVRAIELFYKSCGTINLRQVLKAFLMSITSSFEEQFTGAVHIIKGVDNRKSIR